MKILNLSFKLSKIIFFILPFFGLNLQAKPLKVDTFSKSAILINAETGAILYEKNARTPGYPASITKVATALYALEKKGMSLDEIATATEEAIGVVSAQAKRINNVRYPAYRLEPGGSHINIKIGEKLPLRALLYGLMLASGNDAANVIAQHTVGSIPQFMQELNTYLKQIGCRDTNFTSPHGFHDPLHLTTALDMAIITRRALKFPIFREVVKTVRYTRPETNKQPASYLVQSNKLIKQGQFNYPKAIGVKTGYTSPAGHNLVAAAENGERTLIAVLMGGDEVNKRYRDAIALFEAAFAEKKSAASSLPKKLMHFP